MLHSSIKVRINKEEENVAGNNRLHTLGKYTVYVIICDDCGMFGSDLHERQASIDVSVSKGFKNYKGNNLCPECLKKTLLIKK